MFSPAQLASFGNVNHVVGSYHSSKLFLLIKVRKMIKIKWGQRSCYSYGLPRENPEKERERDQQSACFDMEWYNKVRFVIAS